MQGLPDNNSGGEEVSIPVKVTDSIFLGDDVIAHDIEWLTLNQITHVVNCAGRHCPNNTAVKGMCFLTFDWAENNVQNLADQNVINAVLGFIEQARREHGTVLVHGWHSESRPFCLLAIYLMIKYHWNIYKALQYLNSRREGTEVDQVFIHQLNALHARLLERGLIRSKQWIVTPEMEPDEIILHNTFLNSRRRKNEEPQRPTKRKKKNTKSLNWKEGLFTEHTYSENCPIATIQPVRPSPLEPKPRSESVNSRKADEIKELKQAKESKQVKETKEAKQNKQREARGAGKILVAKQSLKADKASVILTEMNVTKKWTQLKEAWMRQKENLNQNCPGTVIFYAEVPRGSDTPLYLRKEQKINDRLTDKINILKTQVHQDQPSRSPLQPTMSREQLNRKQPPQKDPSLQSFLRKSKDAGKDEGRPRRQQARPKAEEKQAEIKKQGLVGLLAAEGKDSRIVHNNWIINSQVLRQSSLKSQKQGSNKSVIMVKPNHALQATDSVQQHRGSLKKSSSERKPEKEDLTKKFFAGEEAERGRCSSVKQQRRDPLTSKTALGSKTKWKL